jgi:lysine-ketoglutarate reductase/saccharopine dehydrogenase-like protein (TIGR00300 family)
MHSETVFLEGHIIDSLTLSKVLDTILLLGGTYEIHRFHIGATMDQASQAEIIVNADSDERLENILHQIGQHGANRKTQEAVFAPAPADGVFPEGFYVTTNLETSIRHQGRWIPIDNIEMDCGITLRRHEGEIVAETVPLHKVRQGQPVVVGDLGVRIAPVERRKTESAFRFMGNETSSERSKARMISAIAEEMRRVRADGKKILFVGGPAIVHTGAGRYLEAMIRSGWLDILFAGNALATHDIENALYGTSLGVEISTGTHSVHGHENHLRAINTIRSRGGICQAVESGILTCGIMHACIQHQVDFVLAGSIRDDGPLPEVITDTLKAQDAMRERVKQVGIAIMVATTLHSVATGNLLPASVATICVDSDADTVVKLLDRGSHQTWGLVTDCEYFLKELVACLNGDAR